MQLKASLPLVHLENKSTLPLIELYFEFAHLKQLYRQGWLKRGAPPAQCESVAEHTLGVAVLAMVLADSYFPALDRLKVMRMALLHDFGEIYAGDILPSDPMSRAEKKALEMEAVRQVLGKLPQGEQYIALWEEYERQESAEARWVKQMDRLEMVLQASVYEQQGLGDMSEFFESVEPFLTEPELRTILQALKALRNSVPAVEDDQERRIHSD
jgi:putative hydrolase of HD superfamily